MPTVARFGDAVIEIERSLKRWVISASARARLEQHDVVAVVHDQAEADVVGSQDVGPVDAEETLRVDAGRNRWVSMRRRSRRWSATGCLARRPPGEREEKCNATASEEASVASATFFPSMYLGPQGVLSDSPGRSQHQDPGRPRKASPRSKDATIRQTLVSTRVWHIFARGCFANTSPSMTCLS